jgi:hypothetical protein
MTRGASLSVAGLWERAPASLPSGLAMGPAFSIGWHEVPCDQLEVGSLRLRGHPRTTGAATSGRWSWGSLNS